MNIKAMNFDINAGRLDGDDISWKYCDSTPDAEEAMRMLASARGYPFIEFRLITTWDNGDTTSIDLLNTAHQQRLVDGNWVPCA